MLNLILEVRIMGGDDAHLEKIDLLGGHSSYT